MGMVELVKEVVKEVWVRVEVMVAATRVEVKWRP